MKLFKRKKNTLKIAADFAAGNINPETLCNYLAYLAVSNQAQFVGYRYIDKGNGLKRIILLTEDFNETSIQYFKDRCPAMIAREVEEYGSSYTGGYNMVPCKRGFFYVSPIRF